MNVSELFDFFIAELHANRTDSAGHNVDDNLYRFDLLIDGDQGLSFEEWKTKVDSLLTSDHYKVTSHEFWLPDDLWNPDQTEVHLLVRLR